MGTLFTKLIFWQNVSIIRTHSATLLNTLYAGRIKLFAEASELFTHARTQANCVSVRRRPPNGVIAERPSGGQKDGSRRVLNRDLKTMRIWFIFPFGRTFRIRCYNFFSVFKYRSELWRHSSRISLRTFHHCPKTSTPDVCTSNSSLIQPAVPL